MNNRHIFNDIETKRSILVKFQGISFYPARFLRISWKWVELAIKHCLVPENIHSMIFDNSIGAGGALEVKVYTN